MLIIIPNELSFWGSNKNGAAKLYRAHEFPGKFKRENLNKHLQAFTAQSNLKPEQKVPAYLQIFPKLSTTLKNLKSAIPTNTTLLRWDILA